MNQKTIDAYNHYAIRGDIAYLTITRRDNTKIKVKFDKEDLGRIRQLGPWHLKTGRDGYNYPAHALDTATSVMLSRYIMLTPDHLKCHIKNGDSTDLRKSNLENVPFELLRRASTGYPYIYHDVARGYYSAHAYDSARHRKAYIGQYQTLPAAITAQRDYLVANPFFTVPGINKGNAR